jgi:hypothetical protein
MNGVNNKSRDNISPKLAFAALAPPNHKAEKRNSAPPLAPSPIGVLWRPRPK